MSNLLYDFVVAEFGEVKSENDFLYDGDFGVEDVNDVNLKRGYRLIYFDTDNMGKSFNRLES